MWLCLFHFFTWSISKFSKWMYYSDSKRRYMWKKIIVFKKNSSSFLIFLYFWPKSWSCLQRCKLCHFKRLRQLMIKQIHSQGSALYFVNKLPYDYQAQRSVNKSAYVKGCHFFFIYWKEEDNIKDKSEGERVWGLWIRSFYSSQDEA